MKLTPSLLFIALIPCILTSCKRHPRKPIGQHTDIYLAGSLFRAYNKSNHGGGITNAVYWKNGVQVLLTDTLTDSRANAIFVNNGDIYVAGEINDTATYWKNGIPTKLGPGILYGIAIKDKDVYAVGVALTNGPDRAAYWKNRVLDTLGVGRVESIAVDGDNIYLVGYKNQSGVYPDGVTRDYQAAVCWKNGREFFEYLTDGIAKVEGISAQDGNVYVSGSSRGPKPMYWKNGDSIIISPKSNALYGEANGIYVDGKEVYLSGYVYIPTHHGAATFGAAYWDNGIVQLLPYVGKQSFAIAIAAQNNNIYVAGHDDYPVYWKNGSRIQLGNHSGTVAAIALVNY
jgi:hypothetical protein